MAGPCRLVRSPQIPQDGVIIRSLSEIRGIPVYIRFGNDTWASEALEQQNMYVSRNTQLLGLES